MAVALVTSAATATTAASSTASTGSAPSSGPTPPLPPTYACSVFLVVGGPPGGDVRLTRGVAHSVASGAARRGASAANIEGASDDDDDTPASRTPLALEHRRGTQRFGGGFGLLPVAFLDRLVECASVSGVGVREPSAPLAGAGAREDGGRWATLRQCRIPALFSAAGGSNAATASTPTVPGDVPGSKRVMSAMQVSETRHE